MAGAGYKLFNTGDVLTAAQVNTYLQEQTVMVFASSAARTTALTGVLAEGMISYLTDTDLVQYYNGTAWTTINTDQTPLTTKGDLFTFSTQDARLAVGNSGETLVADSSTTTGLRWQSANNFNGVINGAADIWQRGTSFNSDGNNFYTADRWNAFRAAVGLTVSRQTASLEGFQYSIRLQRVSGNTSTAINYLQYNLETDDSVKYANKTVTLSFWAKAGANYSPTSSLLSVVANSGTGTNQKILDGFTGASSFVNSTATLTTSWQRFTYTGTVNSNANQIGFYFAATPVGTASTNDWFEITGVQLEFGSVATAFKRAGNTLAGELAACQRYFNRAVNGATNGNYRLSGGNATSTSAAELNYSFPATMRTSPTVSVSAAGDFFLISSTGGVAGYPTSISSGILTPTNARVDATGAAGLTAGNATALQAASANARLDFSAEL